MTIEQRPPPSIARTSNPEPSDAVRALQRQVTERLLLSVLRESDAADDARASQQRAAFLADAGRDLTQSLDQDQTQSALTHLTLPSVADWCIVDLVNSDGTMDRLAIVHRDPHAQELFSRLESHWRPRHGDAFGVPAVLESRKSVQVSDNVAAALENAAHDDEILCVLRELEIGSLLTAPLITNGVVSGAITFVNSRRMRAFNEHDVELAEALAERGALGLQMAHQYAEALLLKNTAEREARTTSQFLRSVSHELRTPLQAIAGYVEIIDRGIHGPVSADQHEDLQHILVSQRHLTALIDDLLQFLLTGAGQIFALTSISLNSAIKGALDLTDPLMVKKALRHEVHVNCESDAVRADQIRVQQILINLLGNAIKFTPFGGTITIACDSDGVNVEVAVRDTGRGIPAERLESIFEPFVQVADDTDERQEGVGLGLSISRDLARAMNGDIRVESTPGRGSTFTLTLPAAVRAQEPSGL